MDRVVLVPGASGVLGSAVVSLLVSRGARVAAVARKKPELAGAHGIAADLTKPEGAKFAVAETLAAFGRIDAVVHVLGGFAGGEPVQETSDSTIEKMLDMNYRSAFYVFREAMPKVLEAKDRGRIVAVGSKAAVDPPATLAAYSASKAALLALVRALAAETKGTGVTVNAVLPSIIDTPENRASDPAADVSKWVKPESLAAVIAHLLSDDARDISGAEIPVYGGVG
jgi:NAD(P)-dependent dehydrogenase (short-subunit alcohol dehydrogenase family)